MIRITPDARLLAAPFRTYHALARQKNPSRASGWPGALARVALSAAIVGTGTAAAATGRISWSLALSGTICWLPLIALQLLTAAAVIPPTARHARTRHARTLAPSHPGTLAPSSLGTLIELFFHAHAPWSLWVLVVSASTIIAPALVTQDVLLASSLVPFVWTGVLVFACFSEVLNLDRRRALAATLVHQTLTGFLIAAYIAWAVQLWPRLIAQHTP